MLGAALSRRLDAHTASEAARVGVEHELQVWGQAGQQDFRLLIGRVAGVVGVRHPGDPRARWLASGLALTADGWEAELVTPPVHLCHGAPGAIASMLEAERYRLLTSLREVDQHARLLGFSTHVNVSVDDRVVVGVAREFAARCAVAAGLLLDGADSPGVLVRPRRGRLEICGEYAAGEDLAATIVFVAAAAATLCDPGAVLPAVGNWRVDPARERFGFFVARDATGSDLYRGGRRAQVPVAGQTILAQDHLETVWSLVRPHAVTLGLDPTPVDERILGVVPLPMERPGKGPHEDSPQVRSGSSPSGQGATGERLTLLDPNIGVRRRGTMVLAPAWLTWSTVAWRCEDTERGKSVHAVMPVEVEPAFLRQLDTGSLDGLLARALRRRVHRRVLTSADKTRRPGVWHDLRPEALVPGERDPAGRIVRSGAGSGSGDDAQTKDRHDESSPQTQPAPRPTPGPRDARAAGAAPESRGLSRGLLVAGAGVALLLAGGGAIWGLTGDDADAPTPTTSTPAPSPAPTPSAPLLAPAPEGEPTTGAAAPEPTTEPVVEVQRPEIWSITYVGTLDGESMEPEEGYPLSVSCPDDTGRDCITGVRLQNLDILSGIELSGPGTYTATYVDPAFNPCDDPAVGASPPTTVTLTLDEAAMNLMVESEATSLVDCDDGTQARRSAGFLTFDGTYLEGTLPGFLP